MYFDTLSGEAIFKGINQKSLVFNSRLHFLDSSHRESGLEIIKKFMLISAEHEILPTQKMLKC